MRTFDSAVCWLNHITTNHLLFALPRFGAISVAVCLAYWLKIWNIFGISIQFCWFPVLCLVSCCVMSFCDTLSFHRYLIFYRCLPKTEWNILLDSITKSLLFTFLYLVFVFLLYLFFSFSFFLFSIDFVSSLSFLSAVFWFFFCVGPPHWLVY